MSRSVSTTFRAAANAAETGEVFLYILTISGTGITTIRLVDNGENVTSNGNVYTAYRFKGRLPDDTEEGPRMVEIIIDNVDLAIVDEIRTLQVKPTVELAVILASDPDTIEAGPFTMKLESAVWDMLTISGRIQPATHLNVPFPSKAMTPLLFPGLFKGV